jgi:hypothetical protein
MLADAHAVHFGGFAQNGSPPVAEFAEFRIRLAPPAAAFVLSLKEFHDATRSGKNLS